MEEGEDMAKDPAMLFYTKDFLTGVAFLSMKERGQYITLLCYQQQLGHMSRQQMETAVGKLSPGLWDKFVQDEQGLWYNVRADVEIGKRRIHSEKQKENAMKRWGKSSEDDAKADTEEVPREYHGICDGIATAYATAMPLANANGNIQDNTPVQATLGVQGRKERREDIFNQFWDIYPKKVGKQAARKAFDKVPASVYPKLVPAVQAQKDCAQWKKEGGRFIPNPATWLNQGRWDDEVEAGIATGTAKMAGSGYSGSVDLEQLEKYLEGM